MLRYVFCGSRRKFQCAAAAASLSVNLFVSATCPAPAYSADKVSNKQAEILASRAANSVTSAEALVLINKALVLSPNNQNYLTQKANYLFAEEEDESALVITKDLIMRNPLNADAWFVQGKILARNRKPEQGLRCLDRALELAPKERSYEVGRGRALVILGRYQDAEKQLEKVQNAKVDKLDQHGLLDLIEVQMRLHHWDKALVSTSRLDEFGSLEKRRSLKFKAEIYKGMKDYAKAISLYTVLLKQWPDDRPSSEELLDCYVQIKDTKSADAQRAKLRAYDLGM